jgi:hypothetical protein
LEKDELFGILKTLNGRSYSFQKLSLLSQGNNESKTRVVFFGEIHVLQQLRKIVHLEQESLSAA